MRPPLRMGVIGAGTMGSWHASSFAGLPGVELAGVAARTRGRARSLAQRLGVPSIDDPRRLIADPTIDAVSVATPTSTHRALVTEALAAGKHVLCETPLAPDLADADAMLEAARASGRHLLVDLTLRAVEGCRTMREIVRSGRLGAPLALTTSRLYPGNDADHHGDALLELALFDVDFALWTFGPARAVRARGALRGDGWVDHVFVQLEHDGVHAMIEASLAPPRGFVFRVGQRIVCEHGLLDSFVRFPPDAAPQALLLRYDGSGPPVALPDTGKDPMRVACEHFVRCVRGEAEPGDLAASVARASLATLTRARAALSEP